MSERLDAIAKQLGALMQEQGLMLATAESCTGGWISKVVTDIPGSSDWFERGFVTYSVRAKQEMLGVLSTTLEQHGNVSEPVVREMVSGALANSQAEVAIAVSGIAGPGGGTDDKPVGTVWFAWALPGREIQTQRLQFAGNREEIRHQTVRLALQCLIEMLDSAMGSR